MRWPHVCDGKAKAVYSFIDHDCMENYLCRLLKLLSSCIEVGRISTNHCKTSCCFNLCTSMLSVHLLLPVVISECVPILSRDPPSNASPRFQSVPYAAVCIDGIEGVAQRERAEDCVDLRRFVGNVSRLTLIGCAGAWRDTGS